MKIAFRGFRGFGPDTDFIEIKDLTIFTGKNGSGKSTFIKLFRLFSKFIGSNSSFDQIIGSTIDIDDDILGGRENLIKENSDINPCIIIRKRFELYAFEHDICFSFSCEEYQLKLDKVVILISSENKKLFEFKSDIVVANSAMIYDLYINAAESYNLCSEYLLFKSLKDSDNDSNYNFKYFKKNDLNSELEEKLKYHKQPLHDNTKLIHINQVGTENYPFYCTEYAYTGCNFQILEIPNVSLFYKKSEIAELLDEYDNYWELESIICDELGHTKEEIVTRLTNRVNFELENLILSSHSLNYEGMYTEAARSNILHSFQNFNNIDFESTDGLSLLSEVVTYIISFKKAIWFNLLRGTYLLYEMEVFDDLKIIAYLYSQSGVQNYSYRSYNLFDKQNSFTLFLRHFKNLTIEDRAEVLHFVSTKLIDLQIADSILIEIVDTTGFIYLVKGDNKIALIDDGSGINNIVSLLLFLASNISFYDVDECEYTDEKIKILIIEEPESNLHPQLQSKMADLIAEFVWNSFSMVIVETHSEYLIRKLQYLVAKKKFLADKIALYYFDFDQFHGSSEISFYPIEIKENGTLSREFGPGFLDEADNLSIDLFTLLQSQNN